MASAPPPNLSSRSSTTGKKQFDIRKATTPLETKETFITVNKQTIVDPEDLEFLG